MAGRRIGHSARPVLGFWRDPRRGGSGAGWGCRPPAALSTGRAVAHAAARWARRGGGAHDSARGGVGGGGACLPAGRAAPAARWARRGGAGRSQRVGWDGRRRRLSAGRAVPMLLSPRLLRGGPLLSWARLAVGGLGLWVLRARRRGGEACQGMSPHPSRPPLSRNRAATRGVLRTRVRCARGRPPSEQLARTDSPIGACSRGSMSRSR
ncbi:hypothetical protein C2845_PM01G45370 [Panicum miliaceum]|uniref:Uncharacterized protein n=1 Tax=Panicum miliaceum TaxID=4540 RepID=A0A3L6TMX1_PANMI|nr:hypothetical protein C2845_PM01G45370 [Panicum miliaceum]